MSQLGRFERTVQDTSGTALSGVSVTIYREGATLNGAASGTTPLTCTVHHNGLIRAGDTVFVNTTTGTLYSVDSTTATTVVISGFLGTLSLSSGDRLVPSNSQPTIYSDAHGNTSVSNPLTTSATGYANCYIGAGIYDVLISGGAATSTLFQHSVRVSDTVFNPIDYGAVGDGSSDDTKPIQEAIDEANTAGGGTVLIPNKAFLVALGSQLDMKSDVVLQGVGPQSSIFKASGTMTADLINCNGISNAVISNLKLHQTDNTDQFGCIVIEGACVNIVVKDCVISDGYSGVWIKQGDRIRILNNDISDLSHPVYIGGNSAVMGGDIESVVISGNDIHDAKSAGDGIKTIKTCHDIVITGNSIHDNAADGIDMFVSGDRCIISGNDIYANSIQGLDIKSNETTNPPGTWGQARDFIINSNMIRSNLNSGISIVHTITGQTNYNIVISNNVVLGNAFYGIINEGHAVTTIGNVVCRNATTAGTNYIGIYYLGSIDTLQGGNVIGNIVFNNGETAATNTGINLSNTNGVIVSGNSLDSVSWQPNNFQNQGIALQANTTNTRLIGNHCGSGLTTKFSISAGATYRSYGNVGLADADDNNNPGPWANIADGDATPDVSGGKFFKTANTNPTTITDFDNGTAGQEIFITFADNNTTIDFTGTNLKGNAGADRTMVNGDFMHGFRGNTLWYFDVVDTTA